MRASFSSETADSKALKTLEFGIRKRENGRCPKFKTSPRCPMTAGHEVIKAITTNRSLRESSKIHALRDWVAYLQMSADFDDGTSYATWSFRKYAQLNEILWGRIDSRSTFPKISSVDGWACLQASEVMMLFAMRSQLAENGIARLNSVIRKAYLRFQA